MSWARFLWLRGVRLVLVFGALLVLTFLIVHMVPGDPTRIIAGLNADQHTIDRIRHELRLDQSLVSQFSHYLVDLFHGDMGASFANRQPVSSVIADRIRPTAGLALFALAIILVVGIPLGLIGAVMTRSGGKAEILFSSGTGFLSAIPQYLTATFLAFLFAVTWQVFPVAGADSWDALILPGIAIALRPATVVARLLRIRTLEVLEAPYVRTARAKHLSTWALYARHVFPNAITTIIAMTGVLFAGLIGGAVIVEQVFARPGLGTTLVQAVLSRDYPVVQGVTLMLGLSVVTVNALADIVMGLVDPRTLEES